MESGQEVSIWLKNDSCIAPESVYYLCICNKPTGCGGCKTLATSIHFFRCSASLSPSVTLNWPDRRSCVTATGGAKGMSTKGPGVTQARWAHRTNV